MRGLSRSDNCPQGTDGGVELLGRSDRNCRKGSGELRRFGLFEALTGRGYGLLTVPDYLRGGKLGTWCWRYLPRALKVSGDALL
ncbi:hypothetical protein CHO01_36620 [Cellulomonas hominis]|uniref:Uncharacterized protein n=1 Tax=Cellulomonas hominis TaxID=156981 RepID=A0A511FH11_9CELL|nr:hypothetical protein CHO01_36620 [Cellulomonas hominis]